MILAKEKAKERKKQREKDKEKDIITAMTTTNNPIWIVIRMELTEREEARDIKKTRE